MAKKFMELTFNEVYGKNKQGMLDLIGMDEIEWDMMSEKEQLEVLGIPLNKWFKLEDHLYHNPITPGLSSSGMKSIYHNTPKKYKYYKDNPQVGSRDALVFGRAAHKYILEPEDFLSEYFIYPGDIRKNSAAYKKYVNDANGKEMIKDTAYIQLQGMADSLKSYYGFLDFLRSGTNEQAMFVYDEEYDSVLRVKVDALTKDKVLDLKTTNSAATDDFTKSIATFGYDLQAWLYLRICQLGGDSKRMFGFVAVEKEPPYLVNGIMIDPEDINYYTDKVARQTMETYKYCIQTGDWFGYDMNVQSRTKAPFKMVKLPNWYKYNIDEMSGFEG